MDFKIKAFRGPNNSIVVFAALEIQKRWNRPHTGKVQTARLLIGIFKREQSCLDVVYTSSGAWDGVLRINPKYLPEGELEEISLTSAQIKRVKNPYARA